MEKAIQKDEEGHHYIQEEEHHHHEMNYDSAKPSQMDGEDQ